MKAEATIAARFDEARCAELDAELESLPPEPPSPKPSPPPEPAAAARPRLRLVLPTEILPAPVYAALRARYGDEATRALLAVLARPTWQARRGLALEAARLLLERNATAPARYVHSLREEADKRLDLAAEQAEVERGRELDALPLGGPPPDTPRPPEAAPTRKVEPPPPPLRPARPALVAKFLALVPPEAPP